MTDYLLHVVIYSIDFASETSVSKIVIISKQNIGKYVCVCMHACTCSHGCVCITLSE
jgi:hypothetical protein